MRTIIKKIIHRLGFEVRRRKIETGFRSNISEINMIGGLQRAYSRGLDSIETVVDLGAAEGLWSISATRLWPKANYILFEPLEEREILLQNLTKQYPNFYFVPKAAGEGESSVNLLVTDCLDGSMITDKVDSPEKIRTIAVTSVDIEIDKLQLKGPYIVKLDTHGFEVPILEGCSKILDQVSLFIIECYGFRITKDSLLFGEMCQYMEDKGFRLVDVVDICHRPSDQMFWQCDAFFEPINSLRFKINTFN